MKVFTTINPYSNYEAQNEALLSWSKYYDVYSVNTSDEIEISKEKFPYINFIETDDIFDYNGRKLVRLNAILDIIKIIDTVDCAIINSDIILNKKINNIPDNGLVIASRWELNENEKPYQFNDGYDLFIFNKSLINLLKNNKYVIGMPWWDFWIPLISIKAGVRVYHIKNHLISHRTHQTNYDKDIWIKFGEYLYEDIMINLLKNPIKEKVYTFCSGVKDFIEKKQINIKVK
jgi:hypothetical protein